MSEPTDEQEQDGKQVAEWVPNLAVRRKAWEDAGEVVKRFSAAIEEWQRALAAYRTIIEQPRPNEDR